MKCVFVGSLKEDSGYIVEVLQEKEYEIIQAGEYDQIEKTINPVWNLRQRLRCMICCH